MAQATHIVVMSKPAVPGRVKTRLLGWAPPQVAAGIHAAMLACVLERVGGHPWGGGLVGRVLALDDTRLDKPLRPQAIGVEIPPGWVCIPQGLGDLGDRLTHVWQAVGGGAVVFLGADCPDIPVGQLSAILPALDDADVVLGPAGDGGYWTLAARRFEPRLLMGIDWGTPSVYDQTVSAAKQAGLRVHPLNPWGDIDHPQDVMGLRQRLELAQEPALIRLRTKLNQLLQDVSL